MNVYANKPMDTQPNKWKFQIQIQAEYILTHHTISPLLTYNSMQLAIDNNYTPTSPIIQ